MHDGENTEPAAVTEPVTMVPQQRGPEMFLPPVSAPPVSGPPPIHWQQPGYPAAPPPSPRRRRWPLISGLVVASVLVLALIVWVAAQGPSGQTAAAPPSAAASVSASAGPVAATTGTGEPTVADKIRTALDKQAKALLAGDQNGYLEGVAAGLKDGYRRRFGSLRSLGVQAWTPNLIDKPSQSSDGSGSWDVIVQYDYCLGEGCKPESRQFVQTSWTISGSEATVTKYAQATDPWDASDLKAVTGHRVIVAGSGSTANKLQQVLSAADVAAEVADRYAHWGPAPKWYIVYVASPSEWKTWFDNTDLGPYYDGYSMGAQGVVIPVDDLGRPYLQIVLTHEFGHVVTIGDNYPTAEQWWLQEGVAEYIADRNGEATRSRLPSIHKFVKQGWDGQIAMGPPPERAGGVEIDARYGIALLGISCLAKRFGEAKMLDFWGDVVREKQSLESASSARFATAWAGVASACAGEVRKA
nr:hypothetical protein GCM10020063_061340 [Dactylosporangium thailandense]